MCVSSTPPCPGDVLCVRPGYEVSLRAVRPLAAGWRGVALKPIPERGRPVTRSSPLSLSLSLSPTPSAALHAIPPPPPPPPSLSLFFCLLRIPHRSFPIRRSSENKGTFTSPTTRTWTATAWPGRRWRTSTPRRSTWSTGTRSASTTTWSR